MSKNGKDILKIALTVIAVVSVIYIIAPIDLIPDVALGVGQTDDAGAFLTALISGTAAVIRARNEKKTVNVALAVQNSGNEKVSATE